MLITIVMYYVSEPYANKYCNVFSYFNCAMYAVAALPIFTCESLGNFIGHPHVMLYILIRYFYVSHFSVAPPGNPQMVLHFV
jgi:hypothetical protein